MKTLNPALNFNKAVKHVTRARVDYLTKSGNTARLSREFDKAYKSAMKKFAVDLTLLG